MRVSVIMPVERVGTTAGRAIESVLGQRAPFAFELITVSAEPLELPVTGRMRNIVEGERNPARRRNVASASATGEILAFIDDDAEAGPDWLATAVGYLDAHPEVLAVGGPDPAPADSTVAELVSDTLLATRWIGSGIACHEDRPGIFAVRQPSDVALVNLVVRKSAFEAAGGFDEAIGYIGEDTGLIEVLRKNGAVVYHEAVRVAHRRRPFPGPYLRQRWRYRVKTGRMLVRGAEAYRRNPKVWALLAAGCAGIATAIVSPRLFGGLLILYAAGTLALSLPRTRLRPWWWPILPPAFAAHHGTYFLGIVWGALAEVIGSRN